MPKYIYNLTNGKKLTLEGDEAPTPKDVADAAQEHGVTVIPGDVEAAAAQTKAENQSSLWSSIIKPTASAIGNGLVDSAKGVVAPVALTARYLADPLKTSLALGSDIQGISTSPAVTAAKEAVAHPSEILPAFAQGASDPTIGGNAIGQLLGVGALASPQRLIAPGRIITKGLAATAKPFDALAQSVPLQKGVVGGIGATTLAAAGAPAAVGMGGDVALGALGAGAAESRLGSILPGVKPSIAGNTLLKAAGTAVQTATEDALESGLRGQDVLDSPGVKAAEADLKKVQKIAGPTTGVGRLATGIAKGLRAPDRFMQSLLPPPTNAIGGNIVPGPVSPTMLITQPNAIGGAIPAEPIYPPTNALGGNIPPGPVTPTMLTKPAAPGAPSPPDVPPASVMPGVGPTPPPPGAPAPGAPPPGAPPAPPPVDPAIARDAAVTQNLTNSGVLNTGTRWDPAAAATAYAKTTADTVLNRTPEAYAKNIADTVLNRTPSSALKPELGLKPTDLGAGAPASMPASDPRSGMLPLGMTADTALGDLIGPGVQHGAATATPTQSIQDFINAAPSNRMNAGVVTDATPAAQKAAITSKLAETPDSVMHTVLSKTPENLNDTLNEAQPGPGPAATNPAWDKFISKPTVKSPPLVEAPPEAGPDALAQGLHDLQREHSAGDIGKIINPEDPEAGANAVRAVTEDARRAPDRALRPLLDDLQKGRMTPNVNGTINQLLQQYRRYGTVGDSPLEQQVFDLLYKNGHIDQETLQRMDIMNKLKPPTP